MSKPAKRHHYLAQSYLAGFTDDGTKDGKLYALDLKTGKCFQTSPINVAVQKDYFTVDHPDIEPDEIETLFSKMETDISNVLKNIVSNKTLPDGKDLEILINLVALNFIRNPYSREGFKKSMQEVADKILSIRAATEERWEITKKQLKDAGKEINKDVSYEQFKDFLARGEYDIEVDKGYLISDQLQKLTILAPLLMERNWSLLISPEASSGFICSDQPVSLVSKIPDLKFGVGFGMPYTHVIMPLSKTLLLTGDYDIPSFTDTLPEDVIAAFNGITVYMAQGQLYSPNKNFKCTMPDGKIGTFSDLETYVKQFIAGQNQGG